MKKFFVSNNTVMIVTLISWLVISVLEYGFFGIGGWLLTAIIQAGITVICRFIDIKIEMSTAKNSWVGTILLVIILISRIVWHFYTKSLAAPYLY